MVWITDDAGEVIRPRDFDVLEELFANATDCAELARTFLAIDSRAGWEAKAADLHLATEADIDCYRTRWDSRTIRKGFQRAINLVALEGKPLKIMCAIGPRDAVTVQIADDAVIVCVEGPVKEPTNVPAR